MSSREHEACATCHAAIHVARFLRPSAHRRGELHLSILTMSSSNNSPPYQPYQTYGQESAPIPEYAEAYYGHRLSNKESPRSPDIGSPGLESVMADEGDKEVAAQHYWSKPEPMAQSWRYREDRREEKKGRTVCGLSVLWFCILLAAIVALAVGLGVGLGVGLSGDE